ncbi:hypothetical protein F4861DRAFT_150730 [Xylaria intraflava]|nr:hypothetical protein F4861DRAFT_150730 [Xylaria intraflava]
MPESKMKYDLIRRGEKKPTKLGALTFIILRLADIPLQAAILTPTQAGLGTRFLTWLGLRTIVTSTTSALTPSLLRPIGALTSIPSAFPAWMGPLAVLTPTGSLLLLMSAGSATKQIYWLLCLSQESFPVPVAAAVSWFNTTVNSINALLFLALGTTSLLSRPQVTASLASADVTLPWSTIIGALFYVVGMAIEAGSERQRAVFKSRPENEGKVCKVGMWSWARHINYFGYALWRGGYCMVACGWVGGLAMGTWHGWDLSHRAVGVLDEYCSNRYKQQWVQFKQEVPYKIIPGVY